MNQLLAIGIFLLTYALIVIKPKGINEAHAALIGAVLAVLFLLEPQHVVEALGFSTGEMPIPLVTTWNVVLILIALMIISTLLDDYGFFEYCARKAINASGNSGQRLFLYTYLVVCSISLFAGNDVVILTTTPIILIFCKNAHINPKPYMYASFFAANTFSMPLYIGNLTNILVGDSFGLDYFGFTRYMLLPTVAAASINYHILKYIFRKQIPDNFDCSHNIENPVKNRTLVALGLCILSGIIIFGGIANYYKVPISAVTTAGALILIISENNIMYRLKRISWNVVIFVVSLFIVVKSLDVNGVTSKIGEILFYLISGNTFTTVYAVSLLSAVMCNVINNIPMTAMMLSIIKQAELSPAMNTAMGYSLVIGSNLGANFTTFAALAGILWLESARRYGWNTTITDLLKIGLFVTPIAIFGATLVLSIELMF